MNKDNHLILETYRNIGENILPRGLVKDNSTPAQKLGNTIKGWDWVANKPSPQTGKYYPAAKQFSDGRTQMKVGEMMDSNLKVRPQWSQDFNASVVQWLKDLVTIMHPSINQIKGMLNIPEDISPKNQQQYQQSILQTVSQMAPPASTMARGQVPVKPSV